jgi:glycosyltransferase involved in cell wall biosynthesis
MRALLFTTLFPSRHDPTRGIYNLRGFEALASFCEVQIVAPVAAWRRIRRPGDWWRHIVEHHNGLTVSYPTYWTVPRIAKAMHAEAMYRFGRARVIALNRERPFDVILGAFAYPDVVAASRLAEELNLPLVALVLGSDMNELAQKPELRDQIRVAFLRASSVVAVSGGLRSRVLELGIPPDRVIVQHNGVDGECFQIRDLQAARRTLGIPTGERVICFVGNLVHEKGPDVLIDAFARLTASGFSDLRVVFGGEGRQKEELRSKAAALGIGDRIHFLGRLSADEVAVCMAAANVLCLPSRREGCPNVVLEALASGRPVIGSAVGGVPELLNDRNGIMVPPDDPDALAAAITTALQRNWDPVDLRASVPSLSWKDLGRTLHNELSRAMTSHRRSTGRITSKT